MNESVSLKNWIIGIVTALLISLMSATLGYGLKSSEVSELQRDVVRIQAIQKENSETAARERENLGRKMDRLEDKIDAIQVYLRARN